MFKKKILTENSTNIFSLDTRRRRKRSSAFGASMKCFERDFKGKLFQKFSLNSTSISFLFFIHRRQRGRRRGEVGRHFFALSEEEPFEFGNEFMYDLKRLIDARGKDVRDVLDAI